MKELTYLKQVFTIWLRLTSLAQQFLNTIALDVVVVGAA